MTTQAESLFSPQALNLLNECAGFMALGFGGSDLDLRPLRPVFDTPPHLDIAKEHLRARIEEGSGQSLTLRDIDPALLLWHTFDPRAIYLAACNYGWHESQIIMIEPGVQPYVLAPYKRHFMPAHFAPSYQVGRNRRRLKERAA